MENGLYTEAGGSSSGALELAYTGIHCIRCPTMTASIQSIIAMTRCKVKVLTMSLRGQVVDTGRRKRST